MSDRRSFLRGLASLPLIGGGVTLIGSPTAAAVPVTPELMTTYAEWLDLERWRTLRDLYGPKLAMEAERHHRVYGDIWDWHTYDKAAPTSRAAIVLSAVGVPISAG